jgi:hypothetical protein
VESGVQAPHSTAEPRQTHTGSASPSRGYKQGEEWKEIDSLGSDDLLPMAELHRQAWVWIMEQRQAERKAA